MKILTIICLLFTISAKSQEPAKIENDTLYYAGQKYWEVKEIRMGYGSSQNKDFAFIWLFYCSHLIHTTFCNV